MRPALCEDALRLGRVLAELMPGEPEVHGLVALMEIQASRLRGAGGPGGRAGAAAGPEPRALGPAADPPRAGGARRGPSSSAARSARTRCRPRSPPATRVRATAEETDWARIAALYDALAQLTPSPVVELNRAVARGDGVRSRRPGWRWWTAWPASRHYVPITFCPTCAASCWHDWVAMRRREPSSSAPRR